MSKVYIGIDPGKKGFITVLEDRENQMFAEIPVDKSDKVDVQELYNLIKNIEKIYYDSEIVCGVEEVHALFGASASSTFNFGYTLGVIHGVLSSTGWRVLRIPPKQWQKEMWSGITPVRVKSKSGKTEVIDTKATSIMACKQLFPKVDLRRTERSKKDDDNKCDSLLIAEYLKRKNF